MTNTATTTPAPSAIAIEAAAAAVARIYERAGPIATARSIGEDEIRDELEAAIESALAQATAGMAELGATIDGLVEENQALLRANARLRRGYEKALGLQEPGRRPTPSRSRTEWRSAILARGPIDRRTVVELQDEALARLMTKGGLRADEAIVTLTESILRTLKAVTADAADLAVPDDLDAPL